MATIKVKQNNQWVGIDALKGEDAFLTANKTSTNSTLPVNHILDGTGIYFTIDDGVLTINNDIRNTIRSTTKSTNGRPGGEQAIRDALDQQNVLFERKAYNINTQCLSPGFYPLAKNTTNYPSGAEEYGCVMVVPHYEKIKVNDSGEYSISANNGQFCTQVYFTDGNDGVAGDAIFFRGRNSSAINSSSNWEPWKRLLTNADLTTINSRLSAIETQLGIS